VTGTAKPKSSAIRAVNRSKLVEVLRLAGVATREELVATTELSRATVSSLLGELRASGLIRECPIRDDRRSGRPVLSITLDRSAGLAIAIDVGARHLGVAIGDFSRRLLAERRVVLPRGYDPQRGTRVVLECVAETLTETSAEQDHVMGAAISVAAPVVPHNERTSVPGLLPSMDGKALAEEVTRTWGVPTEVENDANLGALAESVWGEFAGAQNLLYVKLTNGVGLGIVASGTIYRGSDGSAGEFGHITAYPGGERCWCGRRGCLGLYVGFNGIMRQLGCHPGQHQVADLLAADKAGNTAVRAVLDRAVSALGHGLVTLAFLFRPEAIVIGGELAALGDRFLGPLRAELAGIAFGAPIALGVSSLGDRASILGAHALILAETTRFADRSAVPAG